jgi:polysaccharide biosynthesis PFTS motif protein
MLSNPEAQFVKSRTWVLRRAFSKSKFRLVVLCLLFIGLFFKRRKVPTAIIYTLTPAQVYFNSSPEQVLRVLREVRFSSRANLEEPIVEVRSIRTFLIPHPNFVYDAAIYILHKVLNRSTYLSVLKMIDKEVSNLDNLSVCKLKNFKEHIFDPVLYTLFFSQLGNKIDLITTQSSFFKVPPSFKIKGGPKKIMAWYSTNSKPIYASNDKERRGVNVDEFKNIIDEHWVWNSGEISFLQSHSIENVIAVGPVIFQDRIIEEKDTKKFVITYFDVTPLQGSVDFYSEKNTSVVLNNILRLIDHLEAKYPGRTIVRVKPKRKYSKYHAEKYISLLTSSTKQNKIKGLPASANLYQTISQSDLVLAIPFTSPALLGKELGVNSYFVSTGIDGWDVPKSSEEIPVIYQFQELLNHVEKEIERKFIL